MVGEGKRVAELEAENVELRELAERLREQVGFRAHLRAWLAVPPTAVWTATVPVAQQPWDPSRPGEVDVAAAVWAALADDEHKLLDAVGRSGKIEVAEMARVLGMTGVFAAQGGAGRVNDACGKAGRVGCLTFSVEVERLYLDLDPGARRALARQP